MGGIKVQSKVSIESGNLTINTVTFDITATLGSILFTAFSIGSTDPSIVVPLGWTLYLDENAGANEQLAIAYKVSDGTETSLTWQRTGKGRPSSVWFGEYSGLSGVAPDVPAKFTASVGAVTSQSTGTTIATTQSDTFAISFMGTNVGNNVDLGASWSNSFIVDSEVDLVVAGAAVSVATKDLTSIQTVESTFSTTDAGDFMIASVLVWQSAAAAPPTSIISGTITSTTVQQNIVGGDKTAKVTLSGAVFKAPGTGPIGDTSDSQALVDNYVSAQSEAEGWNAEVIILLNMTLNPGILNRISDTECELTLPAVPNYVITDDEILTWTIPSAALVSGGPIVSTPTQTILSSLVAAEGNSEIQYQELGLGTDEQFITVYIKDSSGQPKVDLVWNTPGFTISAKLQGAGAVVEIPLVSTPLDTWKSGGFVAIDSAKMKGLYQFGVPKWIHAQLSYSNLVFYGVEGMLEAPFRVDVAALVNVNDSSQVESSVASIEADAINAASIEANALNGKGDWNVNKTGYALAVTPPTAVENRQEMDSNSTELATLVSGQTVINDNVLENLAATLANLAAVGVLSAKTSTLAIPKNSAFSNLDFVMFLLGGGEAVGVTVTVFRKLDSGDLVEATGTVTETGLGAYAFNPSQADTDGNTGIYIFTAELCSPSFTAFQTVR